MGLNRNKNSLGKKNDDLFNDGRVDGPTTMPKKIVVLDMMPCSLLFPPS
jgi:hypothetical protein